MDWWQILLAGVPSLFSGILLYEWKQQRKRIKEQEDEKEVRNEALVKGVQALLRDVLSLEWRHALKKDMPRLIRWKSWAQCMPHTVTLEGTVL